MGCFRLGGEEESGSSPGESRDFCILRISVVLVIITFEQVTPLHNSGVKTRRGGGGCFHPPSMTVTRFFCWKSCHMAKQEGGEHCSKEGGEEEERRGLQGKENKPGDGGVG